MGGGSVWQFSKWSTLAYLLRKNESYSLAGHKSNLEEEDAFLTTNLKGTAFLTSDKLLLQQIWARSHFLLYQMTCAWYRSGLVSWLHSVHNTKRGHNCQLCQKKIHQISCGWVSFCIMGRARVPVFRHWLRILFWFLLLPIQFWREALERKAFRPPSYSVIFSKVGRWSSHTILESPLYQRKPMMKL